MQRKTRPNRTSAKDLGRLRRNTLASVAQHAKTKAEKVYALSQQLELLRRTFFRQAMFAEFELKAHEAIEQDKALTGEDLTKLYLDLIRRYHGDAQGVMKIDDLYGD